MEDLHNVLSPVFPPEKDIDVSMDVIPLNHSSSIQLFIKLVEPVVFLQGFDQRHDVDNNFPSMLRGSLIVRVLKPTKLKSISLTFKGYLRTEWPEGIPPKRTEFMEVNDIVNHTWPFYHDEHKVVKPNGSGSAAENMIEYLTTNSGSSLFRPLPSESDQSSRRNSAYLNGFNLSPVPTSTNLQSRGDKDKDNRKSRNRTFSDTSTDSIPAHARSMSPLNLFKRVTSSGEIPQAGTSSGAAANLHTPSTPGSKGKKGNKPMTTISIFSDLFGLSTNSNTSSVPANTGSNDISSITSKSGSKHTKSTIGSDANSISNVPAVTVANSGSRSKNLNPASYSMVANENESFIFEPGDYIYTFEQLIPQNYPETIKADYGFVEYFLLASIERYGTFKSNLNARQPVTIVRTPSDNSVEETEPIVISRDWENQLYYDILIASKDIILDAFLPIHFSFSPLDKVVLHRIRIYITETMEYYCKKKKVHRMEPTKKFLLAEHNGPRLPNTPKEDGNKTLKAKYMGNLLEEDGYLSNTEFEYQVFIPNRFGSLQRLHPDTGFENIKSSHWIKLCLRLSKEVDNKRKHYEISVDSPIHVLNKLCSHANTLLPSYDAHLIVNNEQYGLVTNEIAPNDGNVTASSVNATRQNVYHDSNMFFPKEIIMSPIVSPEVKPLDINLNAPPTSPLPRNVKKNLNVPQTGKLHSNSFLGHGNDKNGAGKKEPHVFKTDKLKANLYQPESLQRELASPQAVPLSPLSSPLLKPISMLLSDSLSARSSDNLLAPPPDFEVATMSSNESQRKPMNPPSYSDVMKADGIESKSVKSERPASIASGQPFPTFTLDKPQDTLNIKDNKALRSTGDLELGHDSLMSTDGGDDDGTDIASAFSFQTQSFHPSNLPSGVLKEKSPKHNGLSPDSPIFSRRSSVQGVLPSTVRNDNIFYNTLNQVLSNSTTHASTDEAHLSEDKSVQQSPRVSLTQNDHISKIESNTSFTDRLSARSSLDASAIVIPSNNSNRLPLLHHQSTNNLFDRSIDEFVFQSKESLNDYYGQPPLESSVDITALYDKNSSAWHPLQNQDKYSLLSHPDAPKTSRSDTKSSSSPSESTGGADDGSSFKVSKFTQDNEPKHVSDEVAEVNHLNRTIDEALG
ncbi:Aly2p KNAG_0B01880 [Huiozyma naganishii CBS 8797]|uniref:Arrestin C-terminal-like domain-containing protein n=1 Tax=Huiozyma naganishii (strain ATCC MYA-139 / BCRC 22969 / CBS 8797 / KCTC 17520 / NBRC 10181 / NCYC 3082 / Yp74L-3) TaxID=1071383 RepID=J7S4K5_HUIN7|nr:hypothetical protein KNAG_0B01880 [Kazachstania naganishii CBS 8797]CCK68631.1 hypothetical protein KNAG_0B01880 [Kazachstania naganishii CBS 8797]